MFHSRILAAVLLVLLWIVWFSLDRLTLDDIPRTATKIATRVSRVVSYETSVLIRKLGFTEVPAEKVVAAPASPERKPTRPLIRSVAPTSDARHQATSGEVAVAPPGSRPADIDDGSEPIVVASEAGVTEKIATGEGGDGVDK